MYLDLILAALLLWGMIRGFSRGFIIELCTLMALVLGVYAAAHFGEAGAQYLHKAFNTDGRVGLVLGFTLLFVVVVVTVFLFGRMLEGVVKLVALGLVNKVLGLLFGLAKFAIILSALLYGINGLPLTATLLPDTWKQESYLYEPVARLAPWLFPSLESSHWLEQVDEKLDEWREEITEP